MRRFLFVGLSAAALLSGTALLSAQAAPVGEMARHGIVRATQPALAVEQVQYRDHGHRWRHRRWEHHHWRYY